MNAISRRGIAVNAAWGAAPKVEPGAQLAGSAGHEAQPGPRRRSAGFCCMPDGHGDGKHLHVVAHTVVAPDAKQRDLMTATSSSSTTDARGGRQDHGQVPAGSHHVHIYRSDTPDPDGVHDYGAGLDGPTDDAIDLSGDSLGAGKADYLTTRVQCRHAAAQSWAARCSARAVGPARARGLRSSRTSWPRGRSTRRSCSTSGWGTATRTCRSRSSGGVAAAEISHRYPCRLVG